MTLTPLPLRLQGLWVGAALGELYVQGRLNEVELEAGSRLTVQKTLPQTYRLCLLAARWLKQPGTIDLDLNPNLNGSSWQEALLNVLPLTFLYPAGHQTLRQSLGDRLRASVSSEAQRFVPSLIAILQTLEGLQVAPPSSLLAHLLQTPEIQGTPLAEQLEEVQRALGDRRGLWPQTEPIEGFSEQTPEQAVAQLLHLLLSTPNDFCLTLRRAAMALPHQPQLSILLGALSGFQNGISGLPLAWRWRLKTLRWTVAMPLEEGLCTLGTLCAAQWAGCHRPQPDPTWSTIAVSPPGQLRPR